MSKGLRSVSVAVLRWQLSSAPSSCADVREEGEFGWDLFIPTGELGKNNGQQLGHQQILQETAKET